MYFSFRKTLHQYWRVYRSRKSQASAISLHNFLQLTTAVAIFLFQAAVSLYSGNLAGEILPHILFVVHLYSSLSVPGCEGQEFCVQSGRIFAPYGSLTLFPDLLNPNNPDLLNGRLIGGRGGGLPFTAYITINLRCNVNATSPSLTLDKIQGVPGAFVTLTASFHASCTHLSNYAPQGNPSTSISVLYLYYHYIYFSHL